MILGWGRAQDPVFSSGACRREWKGWTALTLAEASPLTLDCRGLGWVNQRAIVWLAWVQVPSLPCSHVLGTHEFPRDTLGITGPSLAFFFHSPVAHFLLQSSESQVFWATPQDVCLLSFLSVPLTHTQEHRGSDRPLTARGS